MKASLQNEILSENQPTELMINGGFAMVSIIQNLRGKNLSPATSPARTATDK